LTGQEARLARRAVSPTWWQSSRFGRPEVLSFQQGSQDSRAGKSVDLAGHQV
jgi:hypothetical protein